MRRYARMSYFRKSLVAHASLIGILIIAMGFSQAWTVRSKEQGAASQLQATNSPPQDTAILYDTYGMHNSIRIVRADPDAQPIPLAIDPSLQGSMAGWF